MLAQVVVLGVPFPPPCPSSLPPSPRPSSVAAEAGVRREEGKGELRPSTVEAEEDCLLSNSWKKGLAFVLGGEGGRKEDVKVEGRKASVVWGVEGEVVRNWTESM